MLTAGGCGGTPVANPPHATDQPTGASSGAAAGSARPTGERAAVSPGSGACPAGYRAPDPNRPQVTLRFTVAPGLRTVSGHEHVAFTPASNVTELVFRLWPNAVGSARSGARMQVTAARATPAAGGASYQNLGAGPGTQGTLLSLPLTGPTRRATADIDFTLTLPPGGFDRYGSTGATAWFATGMPLLAWQDGVGWRRDPGSGLAAETATSEAFDLDTTVTAPAAETVLLNGRADPPAPAGPDRRWHAHAATARDQAAAVGRFSLAELTTATGVPVQVGVAPDVLAGLPPGAGPIDPKRVGMATVAAVDAEVAAYGAFPFDGLTVMVLPGLAGGGIEYPGAILLGPGYARPEVVPHEVGHQWFYAMVGDDQGADPWLDEAFATFTEARVNHDEAQYLRALDAPGDVGAPVASFGANERDYFQTVYAKGAAALLTARQGAPAQFDQAIRCYLRRYAWRVTRPADLTAALAGDPLALGVLRSAGALQ